MSRKKMFYHVTSVDCVESLLRVGLKGGTTPRNRGETVGTPSIFVLVSGEVDLTDHVAKNQIWPWQDIGDYAVIEIDPTGVTGCVMGDEIEEGSAPLHRVIQQKVIEPKYLKLAKTRSLNYPGKKVEKIYLSCHQRKWTAEEWRIARQWLDEPLLIIQEQYERGKKASRTTSKQKKTTVTKRKTKHK